MLMFPHCSELACLEGPREGLQRVADGIVEGGLERDLEVAAGLVAAAQPSDVLHQALTGHVACLWGYIALLQARLCSALTGQAM